MSNPQLMDIEWGPWTMWNTNEDPFHDPVPSTNHNNPRPAFSFSPATPTLASPPSPPPSPALLQSEVAPFHFYYPAMHPERTHQPPQQPQALSDCFPPPLSFPPFPFGHESPTDKRKIRRLQKRLNKMTFKACAFQAALEARLRTEKRANQNERRRSRPPPLFWLRWNTASKTSCRPLGGHGMSSSVQCERKPDLTPMVSWQPEHWH